ncbi:hypothetical protein Tco_1164202 [Tanacetum coccineum]
MAQQPQQQVIPADQLVTKYQRIGRCNNFSMLQNIPCSEECKIVGIPLVDHALSHALTATADVSAVEIIMDTVDMFRDTLQLPKNDSIQYPRFTKLIIADLMKKFPSIALRLEEDYHSIKDDVPLGSVYTTGNVMVRGMLIPSELITNEIRATIEYKAYKEKFVRVDVPMIQPQPVESTQRTHRTPSATMTPTPAAEKKQKKDTGTWIEPGSHKEHSKIVDDDDDDETEKERKYDDDDNVNDDHTNHALDETQETGSLETKKEKMQTPIPLPPISPRADLSSDKALSQELTVNVSTTPATTSQDPNKSKRISSKYSYIPRVLQSMCRREDIMIKQMEKKFVTQLPPTSCRTDTFYGTDHDDHLEDDAPPKGEKREKRYKSSKNSKFARGSSSKQSKRSEIYVSKQQQQQQEWDTWVEEPVSDVDEVIPEDKSPKFVNEFQDVDEHVPTIFDYERMEAILRDTMSNQFKDAEENAYHLEQTKNYIENQIIWESIQKDIRRPGPSAQVFYGPERNPDEPPRYLYNKDLFFLKHGNTEERSYILSLHKIHVVSFPEDGLEEKLKRWARKEFKTFNEEAWLSIHHWKDSWHKRMYKLNQRRHELDYMEQIIVMKENDKPDSFSEADFKYLNKNDIEDLYYLCLNKKERVHDFQLGLESYHISVNLTAPTLTFPGIEAHDPCSIMDKPNTGLIYLNSKGDKRVMYLAEIVKFCDATLKRVLKKLNEDLRD